MHFKATQLKLAPPTRISSPSGKTPTPKSPSCSKPNLNTLNCNSVSMACPVDPTLVQCTYAYSDTCPFTDSWASSLSSLTCLCPQPTMSRKSRNPLPQSRNPSPTTPSPSTI